MRIHTPLVTVKDQIMSLISEGYVILDHAYYFGNDQSLSQEYAGWHSKVVNYLRDAFPTRVEWGHFIYSSLPNHGDPTLPPTTLQDVRKILGARINVLDLILEKLKLHYEFEPEAKRLYIQSIDSFGKVRDLNIVQVKPFLKDGFLDWSEKKIKEAFLEIIGQSFVPKDWGGETEDIYSALVLLNGERVQTSMILKGSGTIRGRETQPADLGKNADQLQRMFRAESSKLFIIQSVKPIAEAIVDAAELHIDRQRARGNHSYYCAIDGQDTALILYAYGFLK
jgi:hypothetical protein